jgi:hypothetical protein
VAMVGSLDQGYPQGVDSYFPGDQPPAANPAPPAQGPAGAPPPLPARPAPPMSGPEARLAAAARGLRKEDEVLPVIARLPVAPPELVVEVLPDDDGDFNYGPRVEAILDGLERIGGHEGGGPDLSRLARFASGMVRLLVKKGFISEDELAAAYVRAERGPPKR